MLLSDASLGAREIGVVNCDGWDVGRTVATLRDRMSGSFVGYSGSCSDSDGVDS